MTEYVITNGETLTLDLGQGDGLSIDPGGTALDLSGVGSVTTSGFILDAVNFGGVVDVLDGGEVVDGNFGGGSTTVEVGGTVDGALYSAASGVSLSVQNEGGFLQDVTAQGGGAAIDNFGEADNLILTGGAVMFDETDATDFGLTIADGAIDHILGNADVVDVHIMDGGFLSLSDGAAATGLELQTGGEIDLDDYAYLPTDTATFGPSDVLTVTTGQGSVELDLVGAFGLDYFHLGADSSGGIGVTVDGVPCYCTGTLLAVREGSVPVEALRAGDEVRVLDGSLRIIRWIGRRSYPAAIAATDPALAPITFRAGSLGGGLPLRDLRVSRAHAHLLDGVLVPAEALLGLPGIRREPVTGDVTYHHVELDTHDVVFAEGVPSETFVDDTSRGMFDNAAEWRRLNPTVPLVAARYCAPRVTEGEALEAIRARISGGASLRVIPLASAGCLDGAVRDRIAGWAIPPDDAAAPALVDLFVDGIFLARVQACRYRRDLAVAGLRDGRCSFSHEVAGGLDPDIDHLVRAVRVADGAELPNSPVIVPVAVPSALAA